MTIQCVQVVKSSELEEGNDHLAQHKRSTAAIQASISSTLLENILGALLQVSKRLPVANATIELCTSFKSIERVQNAAQNQTSAHRRTNPLHKSAAITGTKARLFATPFNEVVDWELEDGSKNSTCYGEL